MLLYELVGEEQGVPSEKLRGTTQNDVLKEYIARGNFIYPPEGAMRLTTDLFAYCRERLPLWNTISISGYHFREKGCSAVQEVAFTLANGIAYVQAAIDAGLKVDEFAPRLAFFFNGHNNVFQEIAKFRAARRMWAEIMRERFGAQDERSQRLRFHTQTGGVHAHRPAAREQHRPGRAPGVRGGVRRRPSRCTPTATTRRWRSPPSGRPASRCAPSRSSPTSRAPPTPSTPSPGPTSSRRSPTRSSRAPPSSSPRSTRWADR